MAGAAMQRVRFVGAAGAVLSGWFHPAEGQPLGGLLLAHCFTCSKDLPLYRRLAVGLAARGLALLRFDFTGIGQSEGDFAETSLDSNVAEVRLAAAELRRLMGPAAPLGAIGHSLGGTAVLLGAAELPELEALAIIASPAETSSLAQRLGPAVREQAEQRGVATVEIGRRRVRIARRLLDSLRERGLLLRVGALARPILFLHGTADQVVGIEQSESLFAACRQPKAFEPLLGADHLLSDERAVAWALQILACWFERHLGGGAEPAVGPGPADRRSSVMRS